jgi:hypothetical protein
MLLIGRSRILNEDVQILGEPIPRHGSDEGRVDRPVGLQKRDVGDRIHPERLDEGPILVLVAVDHDEVHPVPVLALDLVHRRCHVLAVLAPDNTNNSMIMDRTSKQKQSVPRPRQLFCVSGVGRRKSSGK